LRQDIKQCIKQQQGKFQIAVVSLIDDGKFRGLPSEEVSWLLPLLVDKSALLDDSSNFGVFGCIMQYLQIYQ